MPMKPLAGVFLALACLLGIAATGSVFELAYGDPDLGVSTTRLILGLALPGTVLSLLVIPVVFLLIDDLSQRIARWFGRAPAPLSIQTPRVS